MNETALIREYAENGSESAFAELVRRRIHLVHSVALRYAGNSQDAQDITQAVFVMLARKAASLGHRTTLTGWLYETTRLTAAAHLRSKARQRAREQEAYMQSTLNDPDPNTIWRQLAPALEEAMSRLSEKERALLALRLFDNKTAAEAASLLGIREGAAHKRTARALVKLRRFFLHRGIDSTTAVMAGAISANSVQAAPMALANIVTAAALTKGAVAGGSALTLEALKLMTWTKTQTTIVGAIIAGMVAFSALQYRTQTVLHGENDSLRRQIMELQSANDDLSQKAARAERLARLSSPPAQFAASPAPPPAVPTPNDFQSTNLINQLFKGGKIPNLTHDQVESFLKANGRNAANLLAAFQASGDRTLLQEAMDKYPNNPQVDFRAALDKDLTPAQQRQWLNAFEKSAPGNALANYLSALNYFGSGQNDQAVQELNAAAGKSQFQDYFLDAEQTLQEAYSAAGYSVADADMLGPAQIQMPQLGALKQLGQNLVSLASSYQQAGDASSAQATLQTAVNLGQNLNDPFVIASLVGIAIERNALNAMDPGSLYGNSGQTVRDLLTQLDQQRASLNSVNDEFNQSVEPRMSEQDWISFEQRRTLFGETAAQQWAIGKHGLQ